MLTTLLIAYGNHFHMYSYPTFFLDFSCRLTPLIVLTSYVHNCICIRASYSTVLEVHSFHIDMRWNEQVVKDVVLTINQAIEPVEKGVTKIQETFQHVSVSSDKEKEELEVKVEERDDEEELEVKS